MTDKEIINEASSIYFIEYLSLPEYAKEALTPRILRAIFKNMVAPSIQKALNLYSEESQSGK